MSEGQGIVSETQGIVSEGQGIVSDGVMNIKTLLPHNTICQRLPGI